MAMDWADWWMEAGTPRRQNTKINLKKETNNTHTHTHEQWALTTSYNWSTLPYFLHFLNTPAQSRQVRQASRKTKYCTDCIRLQSTDSNVVSGTSHCTSFELVSKGGESGGKSNQVCPHINNCHPIIWCDQSRKLESTAPMSDTDSGNQAGHHRRVGNLGQSGSYSNHVRQLNYLTADSSTCKPTIVHSESSSLL